MANAMYTGDEICAMGQKYYHSLAKICKRLEKQGYWREAENMMKQSAAEAAGGGAPSRNWRCVWTIFLTGRKNTSGA